MPERKLNFCPYCGKRLPKSNKEKMNFCCYCGKKLKQYKEKFTKRVQCTICHEITDPSKHLTIKCSYCGSIYHSTCVSTWLQKYNACPMCQNIFLFPNKVLPLRKH